MRTMRMSNPELSKYCLTILIDSNDHFTGQEHPLLNWRLECHNLPVHDNLERIDTLIIFECCLWNLLSSGQTKCNHSFLFFQTVHNICWVVMCWKYNETITVSRDTFGNSFYIFHSCESAVSKNESIFFPPHLSLVTTVSQIQVCMICCHSIYRLVFEASFYKMMDCLRVGLRQHRLRFK